MTHRGSFRKGTGGQHCELGAAILIRLCNNVKYMHVYRPSRSQKNKREKNMTLVYGTEEHFYIQAGGCGLSCFALILLQSRHIETLHVSNYGKQSLRIMLQSMVKYHSSALIQMQQTFFCTSLFLYRFIFRPTTSGGWSKHLKAEFKFIVSIMQINWSLLTLVMTVFFK